MPGPTKEASTAHTEIPETFRAPCSSDFKPSWCPKHITGGGQSVKSWDENSFVKSKCVKNNLWQDNISQPKNMETESNKWDGHQQKPEVNQRKSWSNTWNIWNWQKTRKNENRMKNCHIPIKMSGKFSSFKFREFPNCSTFSPWSHRQHCFSRKITLRSVWGLRFEQNHILQFVTPIIFSGTLIEGFSLFAYHKSLNKWTWGITSDVRGKIILETDFSMGFSHVFPMKIRVFQWFHPWILPWIHWVAPAGIQGKAPGWWNSLQAAGGLRSGSPRYGTLGSWKKGWLKMCICSISKWPKDVWSG